MSDLPTMPTLPINYGKTRLVAFGDTPDDFWSSF